MPKYCPSCGEELLDEAKFCKNCGKDVETINPTQDSEETPEFSQPPVVQEEKSHTAVMVIGYICSLLIPLIGLICGIYLVTRKDSERAPFHGKIMIALSLIIWAISIITIFH